MSSPTQLSLLHPENVRAKDGLKESRSSTALEGTQVLSLFHPCVSQWFSQALGHPTDVQVDAWQAIREGEHTLIAAPTGSGKTLAAFLCAIDDLVHEFLLTGQLSDEVRVLYVSPLKALSNDIDKNLRQPLQGVRDGLASQDLPDINIRSAVRTGDTPHSDREKIRRRPPHILVTTPESLYLMLSSDGGRQTLHTVRTVIVDEVHALVSNKRGSHLSLSLSRLEHLVETPFTRIGLSATQRPIDKVAAYLTPGGDVSRCRIVDQGHVRQLDVALELTDSPLQAIMSNEVWTEVYDRLALLIRSHKTTLVFVNTRRLAERAARFLAERLGEEAVTSHHGSLARRHRLAAEAGLKTGRLRAVVATASLELGIDIGDVDLVCQLGSPHSIAQFLQRVGRAGHGVGRLPKGRLFPLSRDDLVQSTALLDAVRRGELEQLEEPQQPMDVLAQQITATVSTGDWDEDELYELVRGSAHYRSLTRTQFDAVLVMLSDGFSTRRGRRSAFLHRDRVNGRVRARRGARLTALTNGGAIPDQFDFDVILDPAGVAIGTLNEDFAFESLPGDVFQLGNVSYRILSVNRGVVRVQDANGQPPNIPFWFGEAPGRSDALSMSVSRLRQTLQSRLEDGIDSTVEWLCQEWSMHKSAAEQLCEYLAASLAALGCIPNHSQIVFERFFDDVGDMHFVVHSPYGSRINRAWGLSLRKRFCRNFNFELQAAALEDAIVLSLGSTHSFVSSDVARFLSANTVRDVLIQALLDAPMFETRWRWVANIALAVRRNRNGKKVPPQFQRSDAEDLIALIFPDQLACLENISGPRQVPDHPLVEQTIEDCLTDVMDIKGLVALLQRLADGTIEVITRDLTEPSPLAQEVISAKPYAFLDEAPAEERRTLAISTRRHMSPQSAADIGQLDQRAIDQVVSELASNIRSADELHDMLVTQGVMSLDEVRALDPFKQHFQSLCDTHRASTATLNNGAQFVVAAERLSELKVIHADMTLTPAIAALNDNADQAPRERSEALREFVRNRLEFAGPVTADWLASALSVTRSDIDNALLALEGEGYAIRGAFTQAASRSLAAVPQRTQQSAIFQAPTEEWCDRYVLARIHRCNLRSRRDSVTAVSIADFMRFQFDWQGLKALDNTTQQRQGTATSTLLDQQAVLKVLERLQGWSAGLDAWQSHILPSRLPHYDPEVLEALCLSGRVHWQGAYKRGSRRSPVPSTLITFLCRQGLALSPHYPRRTLSDDTDERKKDSSAYHSELSNDAKQLHDLMKQFGAAFFDELCFESPLPMNRVWSALGELVTAGLAVADGLAGLAALSMPNRRRPTAERRMQQAGRFALCRRQRPVDGKHVAQFANERADAAVEAAVDVLLARYGIVFRQLLERETVWLPPWRVMLPVLRRREARGELRAGRMVDGVGGEQFALPDALERLRALQARRGHTQPGSEYMIVNATDCLNLVGILQPGERIAAQPRNELLYEDGVCVAVLARSDGSFHVADTNVRFLSSTDPARAWLLRECFKRQPLKDDLNAKDKAAV